MNLIVLFFLIEIGLVITVIIEIAKKYNNMINKKFNYLKKKLDHLENQVEKLNKKNLMQKIKIKH